MDTDAFHSRLNCGTSTSAPARNVNTMPAKDPMKFSQFGTGTCAALPTTTPANSSISATDSPISIEIVDARRIVPARTAATAMSLTSTSAKLVTGRGHQRRSAVGREPHRACARTIAEGLRFDARSCTVQCVERGTDVDVPADEDRSVPLGVARCFGLSQHRHQMHEVGWLVAIESPHALLVVNPDA